MVPLRHALIRPGFLMKHIRHPFQFFITNIITSVVEVFGMKNSFEKGKEKERTQVIKKGHPFLQALLIPGATASKNDTAKTDRCRTFRVRKRHQFDIVILHLK